jgi:glutamate--cysteine ligase
MPGAERRLTLATARDLVDQECFGPPGAGRVGLELEFLVFSERDPKAPPSPDLLAAVDDVPLPGGSRITFEPGGQVELSGPPCEDVGTACTAMADDVGAVRDALAAHDAHLVALGLDPLRPPHRVVYGPRYDAMEAYFDTLGPEGRTMMCSTASVQVNLDGADPDRLDLAQAVSPVLAAVFANSPVAGGPRSARLANWWAVDPTRTAPCTGRWADYVLEARVMLVRADGCRFVPQTKAFSFRDWIEHGHPLGPPDADDLAYHLTTLFPPVRPRRWLELRVLDALPDPWWRVAAAVATALLDDPEASDAARRATIGARDLWDDAARHGLRHPTLATAAGRCLAAALDALPRVGADKVTFDATAELVERLPAGSAPWT